jgi:hypothetical protein
MVLDLVTIESDGAGSVTIRGEEGATSPGADLTFFNFNLYGSAFDDFPARAGDDGSFEIVMPGWKINSYRVVVSVEGEGSLVVDFTGNYTGSVSVNNGPIYDCFLISDLFVDFGDVPVGNQEFRAVSMTNTCTDVAGMRITDLYLSDIENFIVLHSSMEADGIHVGSGETEQIGLFFSPIVEDEVIRNLVVSFTDGTKDYRIKIVIKGNGVFE